MQQQIKERGILYTNPLSSLMRSMIVVDASVACKHSRVSLKDKVEHPHMTPYAPSMNSERWPLRIGISGDDIRGEVCCIT